ncbi:transposase [Brevibacillus nitrificans]|uniref:Transposase n=1 Tax=Brevibacillus nitrificans TaxID=651560 RepID=A0A3M8DPL0_9BACL|nr:transposase [Brevibacillus nitrificans]RNB90076.1 transposase [Brevibacillus nitrificans]
MIPTYQDAEMMVKLYEQYESERLRKARAWFTAVLGQKEEIAPEVFWEKYPRTGEEFSQFTTLYGFFEMVGVLHKNGLIHPDLLFDMWYINGFYSRMYPIIASWREEGDIHIAENFERLALAELEWIRKHKGAEFVPQVSYTKHE